MNIKPTTLETPQSNLLHFKDALLQELVSCSPDSNLASDQPLHLISVGGLDIQDVPMSGALQITEHLRDRLHLQTFLSCFTSPLARVCFVKDPTLNPEKVLFKNRAYSLFYQAVCFSLQYISDQLVDVINHAGESNVTSQQTPCNGYLLIEFSREKPTSFLDKSYLKFGRLRDESFFDSEKLKQIVFRANSKQLNITPSTLNVLSPKFIECYLASLLTSFLVQENNEDTKALYEVCQCFLNVWTNLYDKHHNRYTGEWAYQSALNTFKKNVTPFIKTLPPATKQSADDIINIIDSQFHAFPTAPQRINRALLKKARKLKKASQQSCKVVPHFERPIFIVSAPRAGSTLLFETLSQFKDVWSTGQENHALIENIEGLHPRAHNFESNRLTESDATTATQEQLIESFSRILVNRRFEHYQELPPSQQISAIRFLEKTPKNALRIPFIKALFPDALFIYLNREEKSNVSSLIDGWRSKRFISYHDISKLHNRHWSFLLIPEWDKLENASIAHIAHKQWQTSNQIIKNDLKNIPKKDWIAVYYQELINYPEKVVDAVAHFAHLEKDDVINNYCQNGLPISQLTLSAPQKEKWVKHQNIFKQWHKKRTSAC